MTGSTEWATRLPNCGEFEYIIMVGMIGEMSGGQHRVDEVTRTESRGLDRKNNPRIAAHRPPKETAGLRNAGVCAKGTKKESNTQERFVLFFIFLGVPVCLRSCAWLVALTISTSFRFTFTRPARPIRFIVSVLPTRYLFGPC